MYFIKSFSYHLQIKTGIQKFGRPMAIKSKCFGLVIWFAGHGPTLFPIALTVFKGQVNRLLAEFRAL